MSAGAKEVTVGEARQASDSGGGQKRPLTPLKHFPAGVRAAAARSALSKESRFSLKISSFQNVGN